MAMSEPKPPQPFSASTFIAAGAATTLRSRIADLADRLAGHAPRSLSASSDFGGHEGETDVSRGVMDEVEVAGRHIESCIMDINDHLDRIVNRLG